MQIFDAISAAIFDAVFSTYINAEVATMQRANSYYGTAIFDAVFRTFTWQHAKSARQVN